MGNGKQTGVFLPALLYGFTAISVLSQEIEEKEFVTGLFVIIALANVLVAFLYNFLRRRNPTI